MHHPHDDNTTDDNTTGPGRPEGRGHRGGHRGGHGPHGAGRGGNRGPGPGGRELGPLDPEASELELIQHLARHLRRGSAVETAPWGLSPHQARALGVIARSEGRGGRGMRGRRGRRFEGDVDGVRPAPDTVDQSAGSLEDQDPDTSPAADVADTHTCGLRLGALAEWLHIAPRSASEVVDGLEELGLVARTPDPDDRRAVRVGLTDQGREVAQEIRVARKAQTEQILDELSDEDRTQLRTSLLTLLEAAAR